MIEATNLFRKEENLKPIRVLLDLFSFKAYPGVEALIKKGIKSSLFEENKKIYDYIFEQDKENKTILFSDIDNISNDKFIEKVQLLIDPQTCGPLLISCNPSCEKYLTKNWYRVGKVMEKNN